MSQNVEIAKRLNQACEAKDFETVKSLLHEKYSLQDPQMQINSRDEFIEAMQNCPFECSLQDVKYIEQGDTVVQLFDMNATAPISYRMRMCSVLKFENGKVRSEEMFYDTAQIPKEAKQLGEQAEKNASKAKNKAA